MITAAPPRASNFRKHTNRNPVQRWLLRRFHTAVSELVRLALEHDASLDASRRAAARDDSSLGDPSRLAHAAYSLAGPPVTILDIGCGEGFVARFLAAQLAVRIIGLDVRGDALPDVLGQAALLPLRDRAAPVVLCLEVLEHLPEPWAALEELRRVCSGYLVLSVPDQPLFAAANLLRGKNLSRFGEDPEHLWHWRGETFLRLLRDRCEVVRSVRSFPWVLALAKA